MVTHTRFALLAVFLLTACASSESLDSLRTITPSGDAYQQALVTNYRDYAQDRADNFEWDVSRYFAEKGLAAASGETIEPEDPAVWPLPEATIEPLTETRDQLMRAIATNRTIQPELTASAVVAYDRWLVLTNQGWNEPAIAEQHDVLAALITKLTEAHVASESTPPPPPTIPTETKRTVLYFPFDSDRLGDSARGALVELARSAPPATGGKTDITINGHADRVGSEEYNMRLSERRARFVLKALEKAGIPRKRMQYFAFGESDPAVPTEDGVEEPKNRRVEITIE